MSEIRQRDLSLGRSWGNAILRFLDRMKPSAEMHLPNNPDSHHSSKLAPLEKIPKGSLVTRVLNSAQSGYLKELKRREDCEDHFADSQDQERQKSGDGEGSGKSPSREEEAGKVKQAREGAIGQQRETPEKSLGGTSAANGQIRGLHTSSHAFETNGMIGVRGSGVARSIVCGAWQMRRRTEVVFYGNTSLVPSTLQGVGLATNNYCLLVGKQRMEGLRVVEDWKRGFLRPDIAELMRR